MTQRTNALLREHEIIRVSIEVKTGDDVHAALIEARRQYKQSGAQRSAPAQIGIDESQIFAVDALEMGEWVDPRFDRL